MKNSESRESGGPRGSAPRKHPAPVSPSRSRLNTIKLSKIKSHKLHEAAGRNDELPGFSYSPTRDFFAHSKSIAHARSEMPHRREIRLRIDRETAPGDNSMKRVSGRLAYTRARARSLSNMIRSLANALTRFAEARGGDPVT